MLNKVALSVQANMKKDLREVYLAPSRASAEVAIDVFAEKYAAKHGKAVECLRGHRSGRSRDRKYDPYAARHLFTRGRHSDESDCPLHGVYLSRRRLRLRPRWLGYRHGRMAARGCFRGCFDRR